MASCKNGSVARRSIEINDWEAVANALIAENNTRAWSPDDVYRPRSLPSVSKQHSTTTVAAAAFCCPLCCEDFDVTDSNFEPYPCGFRVCLFCHKKILEIDGRCPGCRKHLILWKQWGFRVRTTHPCSKNTLV
ncbi:General negative regulator of transcription subunit 4 [Bienertia sinuspersici]